MVILGTRPEMIKLAPLVMHLKETAQAFFETVLVHSGQHRDMVITAGNNFGLCPDVTLQTMNDQHRLCDLQLQLSKEISQIIDNQLPDLMIVQGDTTTALVATEQSFLRQIPVIHIEAGLRSYKRLEPFPEEANRKMISSMASFHCTPTSRAKKSLLDEGINPDEIAITGNTIIDSIQWILKKISEKPKRNMGDINILVTMHRRESWGQGIEDASKAILYLATQYPQIHFLFPLHPNPKLQTTFKKILGGMKNIELCNDLPYQDFIVKMLEADVLLTDSGGLQEEGVTLHKPVLIMRDVTERPEAIEVGAAQLIGTKTTEIIKAVEAFINNHDLQESMSHTKNPFGDGLACQRISSLLINWSKTGKLSKESFSPFKDISHA